MHDSGAFRNYQEKSGGPGRWYFTRKEIDENSPSKRDGIDTKKETYLRKSYCTFLQDLGMRLKVPQVTIATAVIFCHRFFLRQSHARNDRRTISTVCMFLAGKVEETPRPLKEIIVVSFEIINKKDPSASHKIKQREVYEQQKELILQAERVVLATLGYDLNVQQPYKPLVEAIKKFKVAQNTLAQVAWNFVNDGLRTSLCLQFRSHQIAAGAIFLAAKFLKVKLPSDGEKIWWQEFDVTPRQLEEVSNQMLELYEQNKVPASQGSEAEGSIAGTSHHSFSKPVPSLDSAPHKTSIVQPKPGNMKSAPSHAPPEQSLSKKCSAEAPETNPQLAFNPTGVDFRDQQQSVPLGHDQFGEAQMDRRHGQSAERGDGLTGRSPREAVKMIDRDKVKAALKQRKLRGEVGRRTEMMDYEDLIEKELEEGIQIEREQREKQSRVKTAGPTEEVKEEVLNHGHGHRNSGKGFDEDVMEEGEVSTVVNEMAEEPSPKINWKRKAAAVSPERSRVRILLSEREDGFSGGDLHLKKTQRR